MKYHTICFASVFLVSCVQMKRQVTEAEFTVAPRVSSQFVNYSGIVLHDRPVLQTSLTAATPSGVYANLFHSVGLDDGDLSSNGGDEIDYTVGWSGTMVEKVTLDANVAYFDIHDIFHMPQGDIVVPHVALGRVWELGDHTLKPRIQEWGFVPAYGDSGAATSLTGLGLKHEWRIRDWLALTQEADAKYDDGRFPETDSGFLADYSIGLSWPIWKHITLEAPGFRVVVPLTPFSDGRETELIGWGGFSVKF